jgi:hypothetical protein
VPLDGLAQPASEHSPERIGVEWPDGYPGEPLLCEPDVDGLGSTLSPPRREEQDRVVIAEPPQGEAERRSGRRVEPLDVVDTD